MNTYELVITEEEVIQIFSEESTNQTESIAYKKLHTYLVDTINLSKPETPPQEFIDFVIKSKIPFEEWQEHNEGTIEAFKNEPHGIDLNNTGLKTLYL